MVSPELQIILKPFFILPFQVVGDGLVPQMLFKFDCNADGIASMWNPPSSS
jgi:hypothetical protein